MYKREIEDRILQNVENEKVLLILGARQVGKTTTLKKIKTILERQGKETFFLNLEDPSFLEELNKHPKNIFEIIGIGKNKKYIFIDEIQLLKDPSNFLKLLYDEHREDIKLIVSGSSAFYIDEKFKDSLAGRKKIFYQYTLNFREFLLFKGKENLLKQVENGYITKYYLNDILLFYKEYLIYGGYPELVLIDKIEEKKEYLKLLANSYIKKDIGEANVKYEDKYYFILKILSSQIGNLLNTNEISNTINLPITTVERYIYIMKKSFHIATIKPFYEKNIRKELTKMPKVYFFDLGLRNYFINNFEILDLRLDKGALLENLVFRNLIINTDFDEIKFWRTQNKNEVDFVIEGEKKAYEIKTNLKNIVLKKYSLFLKTYDTFNLEFIDLEKSLSFLKKATQ